MRKAQGIIVVLLTMLVALSMSLPSFATDAPNQVILKGNPMGGVKFMHSMHAKDRAIKCDTCHHAAKPEKKATSATESCADCHAKTATAPMKTTYKLAFHDAMAKKGVCVDCHLAQNAKGKKAPTKCTDCHQKANV